MDSTSVGNLSNLFYSSTLIPVVVSHDYLTIVLYRILNYACFFYIGPLIPFALVFNFLIVVIFVRSPVGTTKTTRIYYIVIAYGEFWTVFFKDLWRYFFEFGYAQVFSGANPLGNVNVSLSPSSALLCTLVNFLWFAHETLANNVLTLFEVERVVALYIPLHSRHMFTQTKALVIVAIIAFGSILVSGICWQISKVGANDLLPLGVACTFASNVPVWSAIGALIFIFDYILPALASLVSSVLIVLKIVGRSRKMRHLTGQNTSVGKSNDSGAISSSELSVNYYILN